MTPSPIELESLQGRVREEFEKLIDEKQDVGWIDFGSSSIVAEGIKSFLDAATKDAWEAGYKECEEGLHSVKKLKKEGFIAALDAVLKAMPEERTLEITFNSHEEIVGAKNDWNDYRTALLEKIKELKKV